MLVPALLALGACDWGTGPRPDKNTFTSVVPSCYPDCKSSGR